MGVAGGNNVAAAEARERPTAVDMAAYDLLPRGLRLLLQQTVVNFDAVEALELTIRHGERNVAAMVRHIERAERASFYLVLGHDYAGTVCRYGPIREGGESGQVESVREGGARGDRAVARRRRPRRFGAGRAPG